MFFFEVLIEYIKCDLRERKKFYFKIVNLSNINAP